MRVGHDWVGREMDLTEEAEALANEHEAVANARLGDADFADDDERDWLNEQADFHSHTAAVLRLLVETVRA